MRTVGAVRAVRAVRTVRTVGAVRTVRTVGTVRHIDDTIIGRVGHDCIGFELKLKGLVLCTGMAGLGFL
jgi:hypothetical protein